MKLTVNEETKQKLKANKNETSWLNMAVSWDVLLMMADVIPNHSQNTLLISLIYHCHDHVFCFIVIALFCHKALLDTMEDLQQQSQQMFDDFLAESQHISQLLDDLCPILMLETPWKPFYCAMISDNRHYLNTVNNCLTTYRETKLVTAFRRIWEKLDISKHIRHEMSKCIDTFLSERVRGALPLETLCQNLCNWVWSFNGCSFLFGDRHYASILLLTSKRLSLENRVKCLEILSFMFDQTKAREKREHKERLAAMRQLERMSDHDIDMDVKEKEKYPSQEPFTQERKGMDADTAE